MPKNLAATPIRRRQPGIILCCHRASSSSRLEALSYAPTSLIAAGAPRGFAHRPGWNDFREVLAGLRQTCPAAHPVIVRASWLPKNLLGQCVRRDSRFVIRLNNRMGQEQAIDTLLHEWAHALAWNFSLDRLARQKDIDREEFDLASHDETWGCAYSRVWRAYTTFLEA